MFAEEQFKIKNNIVKLAGRIDFDNVLQLFDRICKSLARKEVWQIDLAGVEASNSAGIALLIELMKETQAQKKKIQINHIPDHLLVLAETADMKAMLLSCSAASG
ncbi:MAG: STAS domain-containing protein [Gammaproteobacteria bacterium]|nr:STAS domain-containing protein [Gammaproteobacteria bacterium]